MSASATGVMLSGVRKASVALGDDITLSRFVKIPGARVPHHHQMQLPAFERAYIAAGRSKFWRRGVKPAADLPNVLVSGHSNVKIGRDVRKGHLRGYWIYTLTLEERRTCPSTCGHWQSCYGNNMPFASRVEHGPELLERIESEVAALLATRGRRGILVRLHALGDFYSAGYVDFWGRLLAKHPRLAIFGYTAREPSTAIGRAVARLSMTYGDRASIRWSGGTAEMNCAVSIVSEADRPANAFVCPEQTGKTRCCATCGACWSTTKNVAFLEH
jgi:hypothetical protein